MTLVIESRALRGKSIYCSLPFKRFSFLSVFVCRVYMYSQRLEEGVRCPGAGVLGGYELAVRCRCWGLSSGPLQEQEALLNAEPSLRLFMLFYLRNSHTILPSHFLLPPAMSLYKLLSTSGIISRFDLSPNPLPFSLYSLWKISLRSVSVRLNPFSGSCLPLCPGCHLSWVCTSLISWLWTL